MSTIKPNNPTPTSEFTFNLSPDEYIRLRFTPAIDSTSAEPYQVSTEISTGQDQPTDSVVKSLTNGGQSQEFSYNEGTFSVTVSMAMTNYGVVASASLTWANATEAVNLKGMVGAFYNLEHPGTTRSDQEFWISHLGKTEHALKMSINGSGETKTVDYVYLVSPSPNSPEKVSLPMPGDTATINKDYLTGTVTKTGPVYTFKGTKSSGTVTTDINAVLACDL